MRNGKLSKREQETIKKAWYILSDWTEWAEWDAADHGYEADTDPAYCDAMNAVVGLCDFLADMKLIGACADNTVDTYETMREDMDRYAL